MLAAACWVLAVEGLCLTLVIVSDELLVLSAGVVIRDLHSIPLV
jgi:hypothetical protein